MADHPTRVGRRLVPDDAQLQVILGSLLGGARMYGAAGDKRMRIAHPSSRQRYVWWKYERLGALADGAPRHADGCAAFHTIAHPLFDDLTALLASRRGHARVTRELLGPLGLAVWMSDAGRFELRADLFLPRTTAFAA